ncbi:uncharacterized protein LOC130788174 [Actinidia eriantha]|uniref:uncharacterized protein LOC130788174 n=1 Tax=Actinidia eriantha TaxID=165200 RepID=UPI00258BD7EE|nr:uncharacterized protein LOC130788174 [Actinidia eriantha]
MDMLCQYSQPPTTVEVVVEMVVTEVLVAVVAVLVVVAAVAMVVVVVLANFGKPPFFPSPEIVPMVRLGGQNTNITSAMWWSWWRSSGGSGRLSLVWCMNTLKQAQF